MSHPRRVECPLEKAEGDIHHPDFPDPVPYNTFLAGRDGVHVHIWLGHQDSVENARKLKSFATNFNDVVSCSYSSGQPQGYWAHQDMKS